MTTENKEVLAQKKDMDSLSQHKEAVKLLFGKINIVVDPSIKDDTMVVYNKIDSVHIINLAHS